MSELVRVLVRAWFEPDGEYTNPQPGLVPVVFDEPSGDELLPRLVWMQPDDVLAEADLTAAVRWRPTRVWR